MNTAVRCLDTKSVRLDVSFQGSLGWGEEVINFTKKTDQILYEKIFPNPLLIALSIPAVLAPTCFPRVKNSTTS